MIASRIPIHKATAEMVTMRLPYEEMVSIIPDFFLYLFDTNLIFCILD